MGILGSKEHCLDIAKLLRQAKKRAVKTALFEYFIGSEFLHSHAIFLEEVRDMCARYYLVLQTSLKRIPKEVFLPKYFQEK